MERTGSRDIDGTASPQKRSRIGDVFDIFVDRATKKYDAKNPEKD
jgi:hypothetical protein